MRILLLRLIWVLLGSAVAITLALFATQVSSPLILASLGGTTLFLFGLTTAPAAQPRAVFGGHIISSVIGVIAYHSLGDAPWVMALAVVLTIAALLLTRTVHPPAGANAIIMVQAHASFMQIGLTVLVGITVISSVAWIWSRLGFGIKKYPISWSQPSPPSFDWSIWGE
ncbi:MAG: HPP family protein [Betaproteobacteria bacterium]|jgi:CBS-domain-containing membrane protein